MSIIILGKCAKTEMIFYDLEVGFLYSQNAKLSGPNEAVNFVVSKPQNFAAQ